MAVRTLSRSPSFLIGAVGILALAIGANTAVFSVVRTVLVRPLPFEDPDRLVWIWSTRTDRDKAFFCLPDFLDFARKTKTLREMVR